MIKANKEKDYQQLKKIKNYNLVTSIKINNKVKLITTKLKILILKNLAIAKNNNKANIMIQMEENQWKKAILN